LEGWEMKQRDRRWSEHATIFIVHYSTTIQLMCNHSCVAKREEVSTQGIHANRREGTRHASTEECKCRSPLLAHTTSGAVWEDKWLGNATLREQCHALYNIVRHKSDTRAMLMQNSPSEMTFRHDLVGSRLASSNALP
jgi:hypothetical protein